MAFFVDTRVVDLSIEYNLSSKAVSFSLKEAQRNERLTAGALKGKFSGSVSTKLYLPPLYGLVSCVRAPDQHSRSAYAPAVDHTEALMEHLHLNMLSS